MKLRFVKIISIITIISALVYFSGGMKFFTIPSTAYAVGDLMVDWGVPEGNPIFVVSNFAPGEIQSRSVGVQNDSSSSRPVAIRGIQSALTDSFADVLEITISESGNILYGPVTLDQFFSDSNSPDGIPLSDLNSGAQTTYQFELTFKTDAGNEFQNQTIVFDLIIGVAFSVPMECGNPAQYGTPIFGTSGNDNLRGGNKKDLIVGLDGNDTISGGNNNDCIIGGPGNNKLTGGNGRDVISAEDGNDKVDGGNDNDTVSAGGGNDTISGGNGNDELFGELGIDSIHGGNGKDTCEAETKIKCEL